MAFDFGKLIADAGKTLADAGKGISDFVNKTADDITKAVDQNGDGKLDISDIHVVTDRINASRAEAQRKADLERLKPLFREDTEAAEFVLPKMIQVAEIDKAHAENEVCKGAIGYRTVQGDLTVVTIYRNEIEPFGLRFYPETDCTVFYVDPCDRDHYIALDEYFAYMKVRRVAELQRIAQALGAKHFRITYKERQKSVTSNLINAAAAVKAGPVKVNGGYDHTETNSTMSSVSIEAEMDFPGHPPIQPELHYLKNEINIQNLIAMRMDPTSPLQHQRFNIEMSNSSGIKEKDAVKIDAALKAMKVTGNTTVTSEAQNEARKVLEYEIDF